MQRSDGSNVTTRGQVHVAGWLMSWFLMGHVSLCSEEIQKTHGRMSFPLFTLLTQVRTRFVNLSGQPFKLRTQRTSSTRNPSVTLSILTRRPPNLHRSHPQVPRPRSNRNPRKPLHRRPKALPVCKILRPLYRIALPPCRLLASETPVRMVGHWKSRM